MKLGRIERWRERGGAASLRLLATARHADFELARRVRREARRLSLRARGQFRADLVDHGTVVHPYQTQRTDAYDAWAAGARIDCDVRAALEGLRYVVLPGDGDAVARIVVSADNVGPAAEMLWSRLKGRDLLMGALRKGVLGKGRWQLDLRKLRSLLRAGGVRLFEPRSSHSGVEVRSTIGCDIEVWRRELGPGECVLTGPASREWANAVTEETWLDISKGPDHRPPDLHVPSIYEVRFPIDVV